MYITDPRGAEQHAIGLGGLGCTDGLKARIAGDERWHSREGWAALLSLSDREGFECATRGMVIAEAAMEVLGALDPPLTVGSTDSDYLFTMAVMGSRFRSQGDTANSWALIKHAEVEGRDRMDPLTYGDTVRRLAYVQVDQGKAESGLLWAMKCLGLFEGNGAMPHAVGAGHTACGYAFWTMLNFEEALRAYNRAWSLLDPAVEFLTPFQVAQNTVNTLCEHQESCPQDFTEAHRMLDKLEAKAPYEAQSDPMLYVTWSRGRLFRRQRRIDSAVAELERARQDFRNRNKQAWLMITVDQMMACLMGGRLVDCSSLVRELIPVLGKGNLEIDQAVRWAFQDVKLGIIRRDPEADLLPAMEKLWNGLGAKGNVA